MKVYIFHNTQRTRKDGSIPIYICIARPPKRLYIQTGIFTKTVLVDGIFPRTETNHKAKTILLNKYLEQIECIALENSTLPDDELKRMILDKVFGKATIEKTLADYLDEYSERCSAYSTKDLYIRTAKKVREFDRTASLNISFTWLEDFLAFQRNIGLKDNTSGIHLRNIRTVMNWANRRGYTSNYPFKDFKIPHEKTRKRNLDVETLRYIINVTELTNIQRRYRDIFILMFYLIGINGADLFHAMNSQIIGGRLCYKRFKTGKDYSIKIEPEAMEIIERYRGKELLLEFCESHTFKGMMVQMDKILKTICKGISTYYSRHTWATIASDLDIPIDTIAAALGHSIGNEVTNIYIDFNQKKVDEANRKVIDYVLGLDGADKTPSK